jgi:hypothetical protein
MNEQERSAQLLGLAKELRETVRDLLYGWASVITEILEKNRISGEDYNVVLEQMQLLCDDIVTAVLSTFAAGAKIAPKDS